MFDNKSINGIYATRYIMSWIRSGGTIRSGKGLDDFSDWLVSLGLSAEDIKVIRFLATNGKMELEYSANQFLANK